MTKKGLEPAFPQPMIRNEDTGEIEFPGYHGKAAGMSTRLVIAKDAMCAIIGTTVDLGVSEGMQKLARAGNLSTAEYISEMAYEFTDALLEEEEK